MQTEKKFVGLKEIVIVVLLAVLTIVVNMVTAIPFMASPKWSVWGGYTLGALISGVIYVLIIAKAPRIGTNLMFFAVKALYALIMGQTPTALVYLTGGVICELITLNGGYKQQWRAGISYAVHSVIFGIGSFTPMFIGADAYAQQMRDAGISQEIVDSMVYDLVAPGFVMITSVLLVIASALGMIIGMKMLKKHFRPAGVA
ncbi:MAG: MptD family putative ECF transporter S component [Suipraeoptans sp.]